MSLYGNGYLDLKITLKNGRVFEIKKLLRKITEIQNEIGINGFVVLGGVIINTAEIESIETEASKT